MKTLVLVALAGIFANSCAKDNAPASKVRQASSAESIKLSGAEAKALFAALEDAGIEAEKIDGHMPIGETTLKATALTCQIIQTNVRSVNCFAEKNNEFLDVKDQLVAEEAIRTLMIADAADQARTGAEVYTAEKIECSVVPGPQGNASCTFNKVSKPDVRPDGSHVIKGSEAEALYGALESTGVEPESVIKDENGAIIRVTGETHLIASNLTCEKPKNSRQAASCRFQKEGTELRDVEASAVPALIDLLESKRAKVTVPGSQADVYMLDSIKCFKRFGNPMVTECSFMKLY